MARPGWAPFIISGSLPRDSTDLLVISIIGLASIHRVLAPTTFAGLDVGVVVLFLTIPPSCLLASMSNRDQKLKEELALFAYGGRWWLVWLRHSLRGFSCSLLALSPLLVVELVSAGGSFTILSLLLAIAAVLGGVFYSVPGVLRMRSDEFAENYKA